MKFQMFDKYEFIKSLVSHVTDSKAREEEERKAEIIADAIQNTQNVLLENLVTKEDLKRDLKILEMDLKKDLKLELQSNFMKLVVVMTALFTLLPLVTDFIRHLFKL